MTSRKGIRVLTLVLLAGLLAPAGWAESHEEAAAEAPAPPTFLYVWTDHVPIHSAAAYEAAVQGVLGKMKETEEGQAISYVALSSQRGYHYAIPMAGLEEFSKRNAEWMAATMAVGGMEVWDPANELISHGSGQLMVARQDLGYTPAEPREAEATGLFRMHEWWYVQPGKEAAIEEVAKKFAALYAEKGIDTGFRIYQAVTGPELPLYLVTISAADEADYHANEARIAAAMGEAGRALFQEAIGVARRLERTTAMIRPDLALGM